MAVSTGHEINQVSSTVPRMLLQGSSSAADKPRIACNFSSERSWNVTGTDSEKSASAFHRENWISSLVILDRVSLSLCVANIYLLLVKDRARVCVNLWLMTGLSFSCISPYSIENQNDISLAFGCQSHKKTDLAGHSCPQ